MAAPLDAPLDVVTGDELADDPLRLGEILKPMEINTLLLQRPVKSLDDSVALGLADVGRRDRQPQPLHLVDPRIRNVLRAPVAPDPEPARHVLTKPPEGMAHTLPHRFQAPPPTAQLGGLPATDVTPVVTEG